MAEIKNLSDLNGVYMNLGESDSSKHKTYLSSLIWKGDAGISHKLIDEIRVKVLLEKTIIIEAIANEKVVKSSQFVNGVDFELLTDRIRKRLYMTGGTAGDLILGAVYETTDLGVDTSGNGKYKSSGFFAGVLGLITPFVMGGEKDVRFNKVIK